MNILMMTNTYAPHVGGVARSVGSFTEEFRRRGHRVVVVAPEFEGRPESEEDVIRVPSIQHFNASDFSVRVPVPGLLALALEDFEPDVIHSHHPFLVGDAALRIAKSRECPLIFTHHTMYEHYTHYVPGDSPALRAFAMNLATGYANLCDRVIAPSRSIAEILAGRGVTSPIDAVPTGIEPAKFARGDGRAFRRERGIPARALVIGHVGRLAPEKNLGFLARAAAAYLKERPGWFVVVGGGPSEAEIRQVFEEAGLSARLVMPGPLEGASLAAAYRAMNVFVFASQSETQGMVLAEAMAAGAPVVAVDAPGAREIVADGANGRLVPELESVAFVRALAWTAEASPVRRAKLRAAARATAREFSLRRTAAKVLGVYRGAIASETRTAKDDSALGALMRRIKAEWDLFSNVAGAAGAALAAVAEANESEAGAPQS